MNIIEKLQSRQLRKKIEKRTEQLKEVAETVKIQTDLVKMASDLQALRNTTAPVKPREAVIIIQGRKPSKN